MDGGGGRSGRCGKTSWAKDEGLRGEIKREKKKKKKREKVPDKLEKTEKVLLVKMLPKPGLKAPRVSE